MSVNSNTHVYFILFWNKWLYIVEYLALASQATKNVLATSFIDMIV